MPNRDVDRDTCDIRELLPKEGRLKYKYSLLLTESHKKYFLNGGGYDRKISSSNLCLKP